MEKMSFNSSETSARTFDTSSRSYSGTRFRFLSSVLTREGKTISSFEDVVVAVVVAVAVVEGVGDVISSMLSPREESISSARLAVADVR